MSPDTAVRPAEQAAGGTCASPLGTFEQEQRQRPQELPAEMPTACFPLLREARSWRMEECADKHQCAVFLASSFLVISLFSFVGCQPVICPVSVLSNASIKTDIFREEKGTEFLCGEPCCA